VKYKYPLCHDNIPQRTADPASSSAGYFLYRKTGAKKHRYSA